MPVCAKILAQRSPSNGASAKKFAPRAIKRLFCAISRSLGELFRAHTHIGPRRANFFTHRTSPRGEVETNDTSAAADAGQHENTITTAHPSTTTAETDNTSATEKRTKNTHFSPAKAMTVSTPHGHEQAKATPVPDNHAARSYKPAPQKTRMQFDWVKFQ